MPGMRTAVVIPSLGAPTLSSCLAAVARQTAPPRRIVVALSGDACPPPNQYGAEFLTSSTRLGFAAAANRGIQEVIDEVDAVALLNDDAEPEPTWLENLVTALDVLAEAGAVQGTVTTPSGTAVDGRGLRFGRFGLPTQVDRGLGAEEVQSTPKRQIGVSATAALFRSGALKRAALADGQVFDEGFDSYYEDVDLALRFWRIDQQAYWVPAAKCTHHGSKTGRRLSWKHSWWILTNRWRALSGNLTSLAMARLLPSLIRGEIRAVRTLARRNPRALIVVALVVLELPWLIVRGRLRATPGPRLSALPRLPA